MPFLRLFGVLCLAMSVLASTNTVAQEATGDQQPSTIVVVQSAILVVDTTRLFNESDFGKSVFAEINEARRTLAAENRALEEDLTAEEAELTNKRTTMSAEEFRPLADAFDKKAQKIRAEQATKLDELRARPGRARSEFLSLSREILIEMMQERRALAILSKESVLLIHDAIDITEEAIARINAVLGAGSTE